MQAPETIAAIATPLGTAGLGIIRISGPLAPELGRRLFRPAHANCNWLSHHLYHGDIAAADGSTILDEVLVSLMRKPHSFTGEDVLEISCHGNPLILQAILEQCIILGCRPARPGEFSERAFFNGRMDLAQAEALASMISARSSRAWQIGLAQLKGALGDRIGEFRSWMIDALARLEAAIDFSEDVSEQETPDIEPQIGKTIAGIDNLLSTFSQGELFTRGVNTVITGKPNVGKSSLLNALAGRKKAIVTEIPGTTRDLITETITLNGLCFNLIDTAGIRKPENDIEKEGIDLVYEQLEQADIIIILLDGSKPLTTEDHRILQQNQHRPEKIILAVNKCDLPSAWTPEHLPGYSASEIHLLNISAKFGDGLGDLKQTMTSLAGVSDVATDSGLLTQARHKLALEKTRTHLQTVISDLQAGQSPEFIAFELTEALNALDEITGRKIQEEVLSRIFSSFCIGK